MWLSNSDSKFILTEDKNHEDVTVPSVSIDIHISRRLSRVFSNSNSNSNSIGNSDSNSE